MLKRLNSLFWNRYRIKQKIKRKIAFLSIKKKKKFTISFIKNFLFIENFLKKFLIINIKRKKNNTFINCSSLQGKIFKQYSSGYFSKRSLKKTFFGIDVLIKKFIKILVMFLKKIFFLNIIGDFNQRGLKKNIASYLNLNKQEKLFNFKIKSYKFKAHNGVRQKKKKRK